jgi:hypothetical protein
MRLTRTSPYEPLSTVPTDDRRRRAADDVGAALRRALARHRWVPWAAVAVCAAVTAAVVATTLRGLDDERARWGTAVDVWVAAAPVAPGGVVTAQRTAQPVPVVPPAAVDRDPSGSVARQHIGAGEVIVTSDVSAPDDVFAVAAADHWVLALSDPLLAAALGTTSPVGRRAAVVADGVTITESGRLVEVLDDGTVLLAVPPDAAPAVAAAARAGQAALALVP